jgi:hypothetical protein
VRKVGRLNMHGWRHCGGALHEIDHGTPTSAWRERGTGPRLVASPGPPVLGLTKSFAKKVEGSLHQFSRSGRGQTPYCNALPSRRSLAVQPTNICGLVGFTHPTQSERGSVTHLHMRIGGFHPPYTILVEAEARVRFLQVHLATLVGWHCDLAFLRRGQLAVMMIGQCRSGLDRVFPRQTHPLHA